MLNVSVSPVSLLADEMEKKRWLGEDPGDLRAESVASALPRKLQLMPTVRRHSRWRCFFCR